MFNNYSFDENQILSREERYLYWMNFHNRNYPKYTESEKKEKSAQLADTTEIIYQGNNHFHIEDIPRRSYV